METEGQNFFFIPSPCQIWEQLLYVFACRFGSCVDFWLLDTLQHRTHLDIEV